MKLKLMLASTLAAMFVAVVAVPSMAQELYRDQMTDGSTWGMNESSSDNTATFAYDYSADGIPEAPNSLGSDTGTSGVKLESNNTDFSDAQGEFFTLYPVGKNYTGNYTLQFDAWQNYSTSDREDAGGAGTTEFLGGGIGYDDTSANVGAGHQLISTNEGGSGSDYRGFAGGHFVSGADMACHSRNATGCGAYQVLFPAGSGVPPAVQGQSTVDPAENQNRSGSSAFQWFTHTISVSGNIVHHQMTNKDGLTHGILRYDINTIDPPTPGDDTVDPPIAADPGSITGTDGNISIFYADFFSSITAHGSQTFGLVDNVVVAVPEPASMLMFGLGSLGLAMVRRRR